MAYIRKEDLLLEPNRLHSENIPCSKRIKIKWENVILTGRVVFLLVFSKKPQSYGECLSGIYTGQRMKKQTCKYVEKNETKTSLSAE